MRCGSGAVCVLRDAARGVAEEVAHRGRVCSPAHVTRRPEEPPLNRPSSRATRASDYERYLNTEELLALQKGPDEWVHRDELLFQVVHQSSELWLKLAWNDTDEAAALVGEDDLGAALRLLRRASMCMRFITDQLDMLEQMSPVGVPGDPQGARARLRLRLARGQGAARRRCRGSARRSTRAREQAGLSLARRSTSTGASTSSCTSSPRR